MIGITPIAHMMKEKEWTIDDAYEYFMKRSVTFRNLGLDQRGEILVRAKKEIDKTKNLR